jgi:hypothetical protein
MIPTADGFWGVPYPYAPEEPPATEEDIRRWEAKNGVVLPATLAAALQVQNGGEILGTGYTVSPLSRILSLARELGNPLWEDNLEFGPPDRMFLFAIWDGVSCSLILNYNPGPEPRIIYLRHDLGDELEDQPYHSFDELILARRVQSAEA